MFRRSIWVFIIVFLVCTVSNRGMAQASGWVAPAWADTLQNPLKGDAAATEAGKAIFSTICFVCHGNEGKGDGINAASLERKPANLTSAAVQRQSDGALFWKISKGNPPMLSFEQSLSETQRWQVINYVRKLGRAARATAGVGREVAAKGPARGADAGGAAATPVVKTAASVPAAKAPPPLPPSPFAGITDGEQLFKSLCTSCHRIGQGVLIGPDLLNVRQRHPDEWLLKWIRSSQSMVKAGDTTAVRLFEQYNRQIMLDHQYLSDAQILAILDYIDETGQALAAASQAPANGQSPSQAAAYSQSFKALYQLVSGLSIIMLLIALNVLGISLLAYVWIRY